jgi:hypothetical protein
MILVSNVHIELGIEPDVWLKEYTKLRKSQVVLFAIRGHESLSVLLQVFAKY